MSLRFAAMLLIVPVLMAMALRRPRWGVYATMVMYYFRPGVWNAPTWFQPVMWITACTAFGWLMQSKRLRITPDIVTSMILILTMCITSFNATVSTDASWDATVTIIKLVAVQFLIVQLLDDLTHVRWFLWWNVLANTWTLKTVSIITVAGGDAARANVSASQGGGANYLAMTFVMALPVFYYRYIYGEPWEKKVALALTPFTILSIVGTGSRGGFLTLFCIFVFLSIRTNKKLLGFMVTIIMAVLLVAFMPKAKWERFMTTFASEGEREGASQSRIDLWKAAWKMYTEEPITGKGHDNFHMLSARYVGYFAGDVFIPYSPALDGKYGGFVTHNTWMHSLAEGGTIGTAPFFLLFLMSFVTLYRVRRLPLYPKEKEEVYALSQMLEATMWAFCIASTFGSHFKIDFLWWLFGAISVFGLIVRRESRDIVRQSQQAMMEARRRHLEEMRARALESGV